MLEEDASCDLLRPRNAQSRKVVRGLPWMSGTSGRLGAIMACCKPQITLSSQPPPRRQSPEDARRLLVLDLSRLEQTLVGFPSC